MKIAQPIAPVDHGSFTTSWDPADGGTATVETERPNMVATYGGFIASLGAAAPLLSRSSDASRLARSTAAAAGVEGAALVRTGLRAQAPMMLAAAGVAGVGLLGTMALAKHFGKTDTKTQQMSREEYVSEGLDDPAVTLGGDSSAGANIASATGIVGSVAGMLAGQHVLAGAGLPGRLTGIIGGAIVGGVGTAVAAHKIHDSLTD